MAEDPFRYFRLEARELLDGLSQGVLELERGTPSKDVVGHLLRHAHTLKGASRIVKLPEIAARAHAFEEILAPYRKELGPVPRDRQGELLGLLADMSTQLASIDRAAHKPKEPNAAPRAPEEPVETVRVELEEMDVLLDGVTEATVRLNALQRDAEAVGRSRHLAAVLADQMSVRRAGELGDPKVLAKTYGLAEDLRRSLDRLQRDVSRGVEQVGRELLQVRDAANRLRLLPASILFGPLERAARDVAHAQGKRISFRTSGGDTRLDAHVLETLRAALLQVVRNAVAHGIEAEAERATDGKPPDGRIVLTVERRGGEVAFTCSDDGRGVDVESLRREAVTLGALSAAEASMASADAVFRLLLSGGLSTARKVTEVSGRGIGLDVVRDAAARLKGEVVIKSERGRGASVEIRVPMSLSSLSALIVEAGGNSAVVPLDAIRRTVRVAEAEITRDSIVFDGAVIPFVHLATALRRPLSSAQRRKHWSALVLQSGGAVAAVGIDRLVGTGRVVVRPLPAHADVDPVVMGAALDAEGNPQLVLDPTALVLAARGPTGAREEPPSAPKLPILVVDDSLTTRMLEQSILESAGYEVFLATSAEEALIKARDRRYGLFVVDVEMPGMDGFEFVTRTRADPALRSTPAILVTSRDAPEDRRRGEQAGAHAYVVKGEFDQGRLLDIIRELVG